jgi:hypothetical protein
MNFNSDNSSQNITLPTIGVVDKVLYTSVFSNNLISNLPITSGILTASNITASSNINAISIFEKGLSLSNKYQSFINASYSNLNNQYQYPPASLTIGTLITTLSGNAYGNFTYTISASSSFANLGPEKAFQYPLINANYWNISSSPYSTAAGTLRSYATTTFGTSIINYSNVIYGEWIQIQYQNPIVLQSYSITGISNVSTYNTAPATWYLLGSVEGTKWYQLDNRSNISNWISTGTTNTYSGFSNVYTNIPFNYYRIVVTQTDGNSTLAINQLTFNGYETSIISTLRLYPPTNMTSSNALISGQIYGNGTYIASASSTFSTQYFYTTVSTNTGQWTSVTTAPYNQSTGIYQSNVSTTVNGTAYNGEWCQLILPLPIALTSYTLMSATSTGNLYNNSMFRKWILLGTNDQSNWTILDNRISSNWNSLESRSFSISSFNNEYYTTYRIVISEINSNNVNGEVVLDGFYLYGFENLKCISSGPIGINAYPTLNNALTIGGTIGIGTTNANASIEIYSVNQLNAGLILSGQEYGSAPSVGNYTAGGIALLCGVNISGNKQLWITDSKNVGLNTSTAKAIRLICSTSVDNTIDCIGLDNATIKPIIFGNTGAITSIYGSGIYMNGTVGIGTAANSSYALSVYGAINLTSNPTNPGNITSASFWNQAGIGPTISGLSISFQANGTTEMARITSNGTTFNNSMGIGVAPSGTSGDLKLATMTASGAVTIGGTTTIDANVGIGTTTTSLRTLTIIGSLTQSAGTVTLNGITNISNTINATSTLNLTTSTTDNQIIISNNSTTHYSSIKFINNISSNGYFIGIGCTNAGTYYPNNLFLESANGIIFNTNGNNTNTIPTMIITSSCNIGIGTSSPKCKFHVFGGAVNFTNSSPYATTQGYMAPGSLTIGDTAMNYGNNSAAWGIGYTNAAGLLMECSANTEIAVHDNANRVASLIQYLGDTTNKIIIGRNMGWDAISNITLCSTTTILNNKTGNPTVGENGGNGDKIILWPGDPSNFPYSIGINNSILWYSAPTLCNHVFYVGGVQAVKIDSNCNLTVTCNISTNNKISIGTTSVFNANTLLTISSTYTANDTVVINNTFAAGTGKCSINFNNCNINAYIGVGGTSTIFSNYTSNLFLQSDNSIIFNTNGNISNSTPSMIVTSNDVYVYSNSLINNLFNTYESQFPPKLYDSNSGETTANSTDFPNCYPSGASVYMQTITVFNDGIYTLYSSSTFSTYNKNLLFNYNTSNADANTAFWLNNNYFATTGSNNNYNYIKNDYNGDWIIIKFPYTIILTKYRFYNNSIVSKSPSLWRCYGSLNGIDFTYISLASYDVTTNALTSSSYFNGYYEFDVNNIFNTPYLYIGFVFNKLVGGDASSTVLGFTELQIFGRNSISNNLSNNLFYLPNSPIINITSNYSNYIFTSNTYISINYQPEILMPVGTYNINFNYNNTSGLININTPTNINDYSYPILKDSNNNILVPYIWYKMDSDTSNYGTYNFNGVSSGSLAVVTSSTLNDTTKFVRGGGSYSINIYGTAFTGYMIFQNTPPNLNIIYSSNGVSISLWVNISGYTTNATNATIFNFGYNSNNSIINYIKLYQQGTSTSNLTFEILNSISSTTANYQYNSGASIINIWLFIVWCVDKNGNWLISVNNNQLVNLTTNPINFGIPPTNGVLFTDATRQFRFASSGSTITSVSGFPKMNIGDFRIYNFVLTSTQISNLYYGNVLIYQKSSTSIGTPANNSNYLLNISGDSYTNTITSSNISNIYIRQYPPVSLTSDNCTISGNLYGNGLYIASASSFTTGYNPYKAFTYPFTLNNYWMMNSNSNYALYDSVSTYGWYNYNQKLYYSTKYTYNKINGINQYTSGDGNVGEWIQIQLPVSIILTDIRYTSVGGASSNSNNPVYTDIIASIDGNEWYEICQPNYAISFPRATTYNATTDVIIPSAIYNFPNNFYTKPFKYFRIIIYATQSAPLVAIQQIKIFGYEYNQASITTNGIGIGCNLLPPYVSLSVSSGNSYFASNIGIGTATPNALLELYATDRTKPSIILSGQEFGSANIPPTSFGAGIALLCGVNSNNNRQLWITDSSNLATSSTTPIIRIGLSPTNNSIDCISSNLNSLPIIFGNTSAQTTIAGSYIYVTSNVGIGTTTNFNTNTLLTISSTNTTNDTVVINNTFAAGTGKCSINLNNSNVNAYIGVGGTATNFSNYTSNLYLQADKSIIFNINGSTSNNSNPVMLLSSNNYVSINDLWLNGQSIFYNNGEKQFPPRIYDSAQSSASNNTNSLLFSNCIPSGTSVYTETLTYSNIGTYILYYSSINTNVSTTLKQNLFDFKYPPASGYTLATWASGNYASGIANTNSYINDISNNQYNGDWIVIKFPSTIILTRFRFYTDSSSSNLAPAAWYCLGSMNGINFNLIQNATNTTNVLTSNSYNSSTNIALYYYEYVVSPSIITPYNYIGFVINKLTSTTTQLSIVELQIFGIDSISTSLLNTWNKSNNINYLTNTSSTIFVSSNTTSNTVISYQFQYNSRIKFNRGTEIAIPYGYTTITINPTNYIGKIAITGALASLLPEINDNYSYPLLYDTCNNYIAPILWYKFDNASLSADSGTCNLTISSNGTPEADLINYVKGGSSIFLQTGASTPQYLTISTGINFSNIINTTTGITFSFWLNIDMITGTSNAKLLYIGDTAGTYYLTLARDTTNSNLLFKINSNTSSTTYTYTTALSNSWMHIAWGVQNTNWNIYINNSNVALNCNVLYPLGTPNIAAAYYINKGFTTEPQVTMNIDDFRVYNIVLTTAQINELYNSRIEIYQVSSVSIGNSTVNDNILNINGSIGIGTTSTGSIGDVKCLTLTASNVQSNYYKLYPPASLTATGANSLQNLSYGNGNYTATASSFTTSYDPFNAFKYPYSKISTPWSNLNATYTATTGITTTVFSTTFTSNNTSRSANGEYLQILLPTSIVLTSYSITNPNFSNISKSPKIWVLLGSPDSGTTWYFIDNKTAPINLYANKTNTYPSSGFTSGIYTSNSYNTFRLVITVTNGATTVSITNFSLFGYNSINTAIATNSIGIGTSLLSLQNSLTVATGNSYFASNVGIGTNIPNASLELYSITNFSSRLILSGQEYTSSNNSNAGGIALLCGINRSGNKQLWITDSINVGLSTSTAKAIRLLCYASAENSIDCVGLDNATIQPITFGNTGAITSVYGSTIYLNGVVGVGTNSVTSGAKLQVYGGPIYALGTGTGGVGNVGLPSSTAMGGTGDRIILWGGSAGVYPYSIGINNSTMWFSVPGSARYEYYINSSSTPAVSIDSSRNLSVANYIYAGGTTSGLRINGNDWGNTIYQNATGIGTNPANIGFTLRDNNSFNFYSYSTAGVYTLMAVINMNNILLNKKVGINNSSPGFALDVSNITGSATNNTTYRYFNLTTVLTSGVVNLTNIAAKFTGSIWITDTFATSSDYRIKYNIIDVDNYKSLGKILAIKAKTYNYKDIIDKGSNINYGFVAQEIKDIIPEAVSLNKSIIPNIYSICNCSNNKITISSNIESLKINDSIEIIQIINEKEEKKKYNIINISLENNEITINENLEGSNCFVYGTEVDDFHILNYNNIYTLNVSATQELYKLIKEQNTIIQKLITRIEILESK